MQGAVSGFIWAQNDRKYQKVEFGNTPEYWRSRLRATAFSWVYSTQFEIGPLSEASIGKVQSQFPQQGFVDHVATPVIGTGWMIAEDFLDRYVIKKFEDRYENVFARMMVRGWLNPSRSFANLLRFKEPWYRDARPGIAVYRNQLAPAAERKPREPKPLNEEPWKIVAPFEFTLAPQYLLSPVGKDSLQCVGGVGTAQWNVGKHHSWVAEVGGCKMIDLQTNFSGDIMTYMVGPRWTQRSGRWMPYAQVLVGGKRITIDEALPDKKAELELLYPGKPLGAEVHDLWTTTHQANGFAFSVGGGLDYGLTRAATLRLASLEYSHAWLPRPEIASYPDTFRISLGMTLRMGTW
ncbi:hypothetical protein [Bryobacter aggregatus]|uniref:hypothetical protein n=1 Tax=Bryobacter aggregatus TaxID=360054 RepID=UPI0004E1DF96|nr:hypothetical protein [Bryobacter aggregatus]